MQGIQRKATNQNETQFQTKSKSLSFSSPNLDCKKKNILQMLEILIIIIKFFPF